MSLQGSSGGSDPFAPLSTNAASASSTIKKFTITSYVDGKPQTIDITGALSQFYFYESILSNNVTATLEVIDSGFQRNADGSIVISPGGMNNGNIPLRGGERIDFEIVDNNFYNSRSSERGGGPKYRTLEMEDGMYVSRIRDLSTSTMTNYFALDLVSKEAIGNNLTRVTKRYDGPIDENVRKILKDVLKVNEDFIEIEDTLLDYNFIGNNRKPFHVCTELASKSVPQQKGSSSKSTLNKNAGFLFFQTRLGMHFISIANRTTIDDKSDYTLNIIRSKKGLKYSFPRKRFIQGSSAKSNDSEADELILNYVVNRRIDVQKELDLGTYNNRSIFFDFYSMNYQERDYSIRENMLEKNKILPGLSVGVDLPHESITDSPSRLMTHILDVGTLPSGTNSEQQLKAWKNNPTSANYKAPDIMVQSIMTYSNLFKETLNITVAGDFNMVAGNNISCKFDAVGGLGDSNLSPLTDDYIIYNVCHRVTPRETYTTMDLVSVKKVL